MAFSMEIIKISRITEGIYLGDRLAATTWDVWMQFKISHIINVSGSRIMNQFESIGIKYFTVYWDESPNQMWFDNNWNIVKTWVTFIDEALSKGEGLWIHSFKGKNRVFVAAIIYWMKKYSWSLRKSLDFVKSKKTEVEIPKYFLNQWGIYEARLQKQNPDFNCTKANSWDVNIQYTDLDEELLRNTYVNGKKENLQVKVDQNKTKTEKRKVKWIDTAEVKGKKNSLIVKNMKTDLFLQKNPKPVVAHINTELIKKSILISSDASHGDTGLNVNTTNRTDKSKLRNEELNNSKIKDEGLLKGNDTNTNINIFKGNEDAETVNPNWTWTQEVTLQNDKNKEKWIATTKINLIAEDKKDRMVDSIHKVYGDMNKNEGIQTAQRNQNEIDNKFQHLTSINDICNLKGKSHENTKQTYINKNTSLNSDKSNLINLNNSIENETKANTIDITKSVESGYQLLNLDKQWKLFKQNDQTKQIWWNTSKNKITNINQIPLKEIIPTNIQLFKSNSNIFNSKTMKKNEHSYSLKSINYLHQPLNNFNPNWLHKEKNVYQNYNSKNQMQGPIKLKNDYKPKTPEYQNIPNLPEFIVNNNYNYQKNTGMIKPYTINQNFLKLKLNPNNLEDINNRPSTASQKNEKGDHANNQTRRFNNSMRNFYSFSKKRLPSPMIYSKNIFCNAPNNFKNKNLNNDKEFVQSQMSRVNSLRLEKKF